eukprot:Em0006g402a
MTRRSYYKHINAVDKCSSHVECSPYALPCGPDPSLGQKEHTRANEELSFLINKQFGLWQQHAAVVGLPKEYGPDEQDAKQNFLLDARAQLNKHITANDQIILLSRQRFRTASEAITQSLQNGDSLPKPKKARDEDSKMFNLAKYFDVVGPDIPPPCTLCIGCCPNVQFTISSEIASILTLLELWSRYVGIKSDQKAGAFVGFRIAG